VENAETAKAERATIAASLGANSSMACQEMEQAGLGTSMEKWCTIYLV
jgi:hypothetical protein